MNSRKVKAIYQLIVNQAGEASENIQNRSRPASMQEKIGAYWRLNILDSEKGSASEINDKSA